MADKFDIDAFIATPHEAAAPAFDIDKFLASTDVGPTARSAMSGGSPSQPKTYTDAQLGLDPGPQKNIPVDPNSLSERVGRAVGADELLPPAMRTFPSDAAQSAQRESIVNGAIAQQDLDKVRQQVGVAAAAGPLARAGEAIGSAVGLGRLAPAAGAALSAGGTAALTGATPKETLVAAGTGAALSGLMSAVARRVDTKLFKQLGQKGNEAQQQALSDEGRGKVVDVMRRYNLDTLERPKAAHEATIVAIDKATKAREAALDVMTKPGAARSLVLEAEKAYNAADADLKTLNAIRPIVSKQVVADQFRQTFAEKLRQKPVSTVIGAADKATSAVVGLPFRAADAALASLIQAQRSGSVAPQLIQNALAAGVAPHLIDALTKSH